MKMKQNYFEREQIHPFVAGLLQRDRWAYHHEYAFADGTQADFVAVQEGTGRLAIVECKRAVTSTERLIHQVNHYHTQFGYAHALKWVFVLNTPHRGTVERLKAHKIITFPLEHEYDVEPADVGRASRVRFTRLFAQLIPLMEERAEIDKRKRDLVKRITMIRASPAGPMTHDPRATNSARAGNVR